MLFNLYEAISNKIYESFEDPNIYFDVVKQGILQPCFCIKCLKTEQKMLVSNRVKIFCQFEITYLPKSLESAIEEFSEVTQKMFDELKLIKFQDIFLNGINMKSYIENMKELKFNVDYNFNFSYKENFIKMQKMDLKGGLYE